MWIEWDVELFGVCRRYLHLGGFLLVFVGFLTSTLGQKNEFLHAYLLSSVLTFFEKSFFLPALCWILSNSHPRATITEPAFFYTPLGKIRDVGCILKPNFSSRFTARRTRNWNYILSYTQKYSRLRCLLHVKGLVFCFYLGWSGSILQFR